MAVINLVCPNCQKNINLDDAYDSGFCQYCGTKVPITKQTSAAANDVMDTVRDHIAAKRPEQALIILNDLGNTGITDPLFYLYLAQATALEDYQKHNKISIDTEAKVKEYLKKYDAYASCDSDYASVMSDIGIDVNAFDRKFNELLSTKDFEGCIELMNTILGRNMSLAEHNMYYPYLERLIKGIYSECRHATPIINKINMVNVWKNTLNIKQLGIPSFNSFEYGIIKSLELTDEEIADIIEKYLRYVFSDPNGPIYYIVDYNPKKPVMKTRVALLREIQPMITIGGVEFYPIYAKVCREMNPSEDRSEALAKYAILRAIEDGALPRDNLFSASLPYLVEGNDMFTPPSVKKGLMGTKIIHAEVPPKATVMVRTVLDQLKGTINSLKPRNRDRMLQCITWMQFD